MKSIYQRFVAVALLLHFCTGAGFASYELMFSQNMCYAHQDYLSGSVGSAIAGLTSYSSGNNVGDYSYAYAGDASITETYGYKSWSGWGYNDNWAYSPVFDQWGFFGPEIRVYANSGVAPSSSFSAGSGWSVTMM